MTPDGIRLAGVIIAGGLSSRMQEGGIAGDKFLQSLDSRTIIEHVASRLSPQVSNLFVNANGDPNRLAKLNIPIVSDLPSTHGGPLVGLRTAFEYASGFPFLLSVAADSPLFRSILRLDFVNGKRNRCFYRAGKFRRTCSPNLRAMEN